MGDRCTVLKGVTIGENSIVAANAVVAQDVPPNVVVAGNPACVVKTLDAGRDFTTRAQLFADPAQLEAYFDSVDREVLRGNGWLHWLRTLVAPTAND